MPAAPQPRTIQIGHSPDPDDAFMFHGIAAGKVPVPPGWTIVQVLKDIESLNRMAIEGLIEVTAVSIHAYAYLADRYSLLPCGASMGDGYGPMVVARRPMSLDELRGCTTAVPGMLTSATLPSGRTTPPWLVPVWTLTLLIGSRPSPSSAR